MRLLHPDRRENFQGAWRVPLRPKNFPVCQYELFRVLLLIFIEPLSSHEARRLDGRESAGRF